MTLNGFAASVYVSLSAVLAGAAYDKGVYDATNTPPVPVLDHPEQASFANLPVVGGSVPPQEYWGNASTMVHFVEPTEIRKYCGGAAVACWSRWEKAIYMPNPCHTQYMRSSRYTITLCHELGHVNGWSHAVDNSDDYVCADWPMYFETKDACIMHKWTGARSVEVLQKRAYWWWEEVKWRTEWESG